MRYLPRIKKILLAFILLAFIVIWLPMTSNLFGTISWILLMVIVFSRPLADIFPNIKLFRLIVVLRKEIGILCATYGLAHGVGFIVANNLLELLTISSTRSVTTILGSGLWAIVIAIPLLLTSNKFSMRLLKMYWKPLQRGTYLFFILVSLHVALAKNGAYLTYGVPVVSWMILWILAYKKQTFLTNKKLVISALGVIVLMIVGSTTYSAMTRPDFDGPRPSQDTQNTGSVQ